jgi:glycerophosphoryl diester phosphodiesterase
MHSSEMAAPSGDGFVNPLLGTERIIIGHRGAAGLAPENTLEGIEAALAAGADAVEIDVRITDDGVPILLHDENLDRTTSARGPVAQRRTTAIGHVDAGALWTPDGGQTFPWRGRGVRLATLSEVLSAWPTLPLLIDVKTAEAQRAIARTVLAASAADRCVFASEDDSALQSFRRPPFLCGASRRDIAIFLARVAAGRPPRKVSHVAMSIPDRYLGIPVATPAFISAARAVGNAVHVWTVDDPVTAVRLWASGAAGIVTNVPDVISQVRHDDPPPKA